MDTNDTTGLLRFVTAGSVDDGKSTLIGRLLLDSKGLFDDQLTAVQAASRKRGFAQADLSLLTDGLIAEREQGITIDVAYRYFATPARKFVIGDTPGHVQYTRNMVTAASTADVAVLLVDATRGVQTQTRRHAYLARWLGIPRIVLAVNKMDLVDTDAAAAFDAIRAAFERFAAPLGFTHVQAIPLSALRGDMVVERGDAFGWYQGPTLLQHLETVPARHDDAATAGAPLRLPVQRVVRVARGNAQPGALAEATEFRGYQGTVAAGTMAVGDEVVVLPSNMRARIAAVLGADGPLAAAGPDRAVTVQLDREVDVSRGDVIAAARDTPALATDIVADLCWFDPQPLDARRPYLVKHGARTVRARFADVAWRIDVDTLARLPAEAPLEVNDVARVRLRTQVPLPLEPYARSRAGGAFIVIDEATNRTVAAGTVVSPTNAATEPASDGAAAAVSLGVSA